MTANMLDIRRDEAENGLMESTTVHPSVYRPALVQLKQAAEAEIALLDLQIDRDLCPTYRRECMDRKAEVENFRDTILLGGWPRWQS